METFIANHATIRANGTIRLLDLPILDYVDFYHEVSLLAQRETVHCVSYFAYPTDQALRFICCMADDDSGNIRVFSHQAVLPNGQPLRSLTASHPAFHIFEREITENFGVAFTDHPWLKPVRFAWNRANQAMQVNDYPFYKIQSEELHEVGVGPIHAGVIEPGHFRFLCNGEMVLHLEIQLGWQHRGIEALYLQKPSLLQRTVLTEQIAGDTAVGHTLTFARLMESLSGVPTGQSLAIERAIALELERIAMHLFDLSNLNVGTAYQLASSVFGALRTPVINFFQAWCGNRFAKGLIRVGGTHYPLQADLRQRLSSLLDDVEKRFTEMAEPAFNLPSVLSRFEEIGKVTKKQMTLIGAVGQAARMSGLKRDLRWSHPDAIFAALKVEPVLLHTGDVWARYQLKHYELVASMELIRKLLKLLHAENRPPQKPVPKAELVLKSDTLAVSLSEGWRGEICHCAVTDAAGKIRHYKVKDPSMHNWTALALSLRNLEISDFPINNKSYNLSYCGFDL